MALSNFLLLASFYISAALSGTLEVIDYDGQCVIWSNDNNGCTGYSASFGILDGNSCSDISKVTHGARKDYSTLNVDACGTESDRPVAWIEVNDNGVVEFFNQNGDQTGCTLENGLKVGSSCIASKLPSAPSPLTSSALEPSFSVSSSLASSSLASSSSESSSSASSSSEASPSTATASSDLISSCTGFEKENR